MSFRESSKALAICQMHPSDCPAWEYTRDTTHERTLRNSCNEILTALRLAQIPTDRAAGDSRPLHQQIFVTLTPENCRYYAGHFRGEDFRCLKFHQVGIQSDPRVGAPPSNVPAAMAQLFVRVERALEKIDSLKTAADRLVGSVRFACFLLEHILRIHPYVNGNGHMARLAVWAVLGRYGHWPNANRWPVEPRPAEPYVAYIIEFRNGNPAPLEHFMLTMLIQDGS